MRGNHLGDNDLLWFANGFRTVEMWQHAMLAHGYAVPGELTHGLCEAMKHPSLPFFEAFRLLWDQEKILWATVKRRLR